MATVGPIQRKVRSRAGVTEALGLIKTFADAVQGRDALVTIDCTGADESASLTPRCLQDAVGSQERWAYFDFGGVTRVPG